MILRRLAEAITAQNWFTVVLEIAIVVIGIFIGLQVDDWNQGRQDRAEVRLYLEYLHEDVAADAASYILRAEDTRGKSDALDALVEFIEAGDMPDKEPAAFFQLVRRSTDYGWAVPVIRSVTYRDMENSGKLALVEDARLRFALSNYYETSAQRTRRISGRITGYARAVYEIVDPGANVAIFESDSATQNIEGNAASELAFESDEAAIPNFLTTAREEPFRRLLNAERNYVVFLIRMLEAQVAHSETLREEIAAALNAAKSGDQWSEQEQAGAEGETP